MKRIRRGFALGMVVLFAGTPVHAAAPPNGQIVVFCSVRGASVELDGRVVGTVPLQGALSVAPGEHQVRVFKPGYRDAWEVVSVQSGQELEIEADPIPYAAVLRVNGEIDGAEVILGDVRLGVGALERVVEQLGTRRLTVRKPGYEPFVIALDLRAGAVATVDVALVATPGTPSQPPEEAPLIEQWWFWTLIGTVVAAGITVGLVVGLQPDDTTVAPASARMVLP